MRLYDFESVIYTDEVEIMANPSKNQGLVIHFNGMYFDRFQALNVAKDLHPIVECFGKKGFHSKKLFKEKSSQYYNLMDYLTDVIIRNEVLWINFPFEKRKMKSEVLKPFLEMKLDYLEHLKTNYRAVAFYLYIHSVHYYHEKHKSFKPKVRIYTDKDEYIKVGTEFYHEGKVLSNIERIISTRGSAEPFLYLSDLAGFMFGRVKTKIGRDLNRLPEIDIDSMDQLTKHCLYNVMRIVQNGLFKVFHFEDLLPTD